MKSTLKRLVPAPYYERLLKQPYHYGRYLFRYGGLQAEATAFQQEYECPVCGARPRAFKPALMVTPRAGAICPECQARERHRALWTYLEARSDLFDGRVKKVLHFAPAPALAERLRADETLTYVPVDLDMFGVDAQTDITRLPFPDSSFDVLICSHVLEHVPDDAAAIAELCRILQPEGWAYIAVPLWGEVTWEDPSIVGHGAREAAYGQHNHVRVYGPDFAERLVPHFHVQSITEAEMVGLENVDRYGVMPDVVSYVCRKRAS